MLARMWGKRNPHILWVGMEISGTIMIAAWRFLEKLKIELPYDPAIPGCNKNTCTSVFIAALFTIAKPWKQPRFPISDEWIKKMQHRKAMEYESAIKKNEILSFTGKWMEVENEC
jgi:hypothetical protein